MCACGHVWHFGVCRQKRLRSILGNLTATECNCDGKQIGGYLNNASNFSTAE